MATLKLDDFNFDGLEDSTTETPENPQEPFVVSESTADPQSQEDVEFNFSGLATTSSPKKKKLLRPAKSTSDNKVSSGYGFRSDPITGQKKFHDGIDIPLELNTPLKPFGVGTVVFAGSRGNYGKSVGVDYGNGIILYVNHLNRTDVEVGDKVRPEAIIGLSGNTGKSTGPHTHVQAFRDGVSIDPRKVFNEDPSKNGLALTIKGLLDDEPLIPEVADKADDFDFTGIADETQVKQEPINTQESVDNFDFAGVAEDGKQIDTDVLKFNPAEKEKPTSQWTTDFGKMAQGVASVNQFKFKPRTVNPNAPGKSIVFSVPSLDGKPPALENINEKLAEVLGIKELNNRFKTDKDFKTGKAGTPLVSVPNPDIRKNSDGTWQVSIPYGMTSGAVELVNAYARGGAKAYSEKRKDIEGRIRIYEEDKEKQKLQYEATQAFYRNHPYLTTFVELASGRAPQPVIHGVQEAAISEIQLMNSISKLGEAAWTSLVHGMDSEEYVNLIREDAKNQIAINESQASIPKDESYLGKTLRGGTSAIAALPKFAAVGKIGSWALPTMVLVENYHRGPREAVLAALPMAVMMGGQHGLEKFINEGGNPLDIFRKSEIANRDAITSITKDSSKLDNFYLFPNQEASGIPTKIIDFKSITPAQRQLILRGQNALLNVGTSVATNPEFNLQEATSQLIIGLGLPVGKYNGSRPNGFERRSIIHGDAYTLADGSMLLRAPVDEVSGLIGGRISRTPAPYYPSVIEQNAPEPFIWGRQLKRPQVTIPEIKSAKATVIDLDQAALTLIDLRRAYEQGLYFNQSTNKTSKGLFVVDEQKKNDLLAAIKVLDETIPKDTQKFFEENETLIREGIRTNYEDRVKKEEFIKSKKIIRKPTSKLTPEDARPFSPIGKSSATDNLVQRARRTMVSVEEAGKRGIEANKKNKGTFNSGIDVSDIPYLVQIGIGKLGRKSLDATEFIREMAAEHGEDFLKFGNEVYKQARDFVDGVNGLANALSTKYIAAPNDIKKPPFPIADIATIKNIYYIGSKFLGEAKEEDIPLDKVVATQEGVQTNKLLKFGEDPYLAIVEGRRDIVGNTEVPKAVKINDRYFLFDGHHRSTSKKISGALTIRGRVIDFNEVANGNVKSRAERAIETFGAIGKQNKWFSQEKQLEVRENFLAPPKTSELQEGFTAAPKWIAQNTSNLIQIVGFHVEDLYRRGLEPRLEEIIGRLRSEFGDWIDSIKLEKWDEILESAKKYYQTNNADPFFSGLKQNVLEKFPDGNLNAQSAKALISKLGIRMEIEWTSGLEEWIDEKVKKGGKVSKNELLKYIEENQVRVDEVVLGDKAQELSDTEKQYLSELQTAKELGRTLSETEQFDYNRLSNAKEKPTRYDLKTYTSERLELEGGRNSKEVLLNLSTKSYSKFPKFQDWLDNNNLRDRYNRNGEYEKTMLAARYNIESQQFEKSIEDNSYKSPHWDSKNNVAHFRANERTTIDGKEVFHSEEFQSDWNQQGRKEGYRLSKQDSNTIINKYQEAKADYEDMVREYKQYPIGSDLRTELLMDANKFHEDILTPLEKQFNNLQESSMVPQNPFMENNWKELSFKRFLRMGIEMGKDGVSWTTARQQQERYKKIIQAKDVRTQINNDGTYNLEYKTEHGNYVQVPEARAISKEKLRDYIGSELAEQIVNQSISNKDIDNYRSEKYAVVHNFETNGYDIRMRDDRGYVNMSPKALHKFDNKQQALDKLIELDPSATPIYEEGQQYLYASGKDITISKGYSDYDTYFVNLAKKIGKKFGAEYKIKEIETSTGEPIETIIQNPSDIAKIIDSNPDLNGYTFYNKTKGTIFQKGNDLAIYSDFYSGDTIAYEQIFPPKKEQVHYLEITPQMRDSILKEGQPLYGLSSTESVKPSAPFGIRNRILTRDTFNLAKNEIIKSIQEITDNEGGNQTVLNSGLNPDAFLDQAKLLYKGWNDFIAFSSSMTRKYGAKIQPHLEGIWNYIKSSAQTFHTDERGFIRPFGKRRKLYSGEELSTFNDNRSSKFRNLSLKVHRGIALAQTYAEAGEIYNTLRGLQRTTNAYSTTILEQLSRSVPLLKKDIDQKVAQAIFTRNKEGIQDPNEDANIVARFGLTPEQTNAYFYARSAVSNVLDLRRDMLLYKEHRNVDKINDIILDKGYPTGGSPVNAEHGELLTKLADANDKIQKIEDYYQGLKDSGYISLQRLGRFRASLENPAFPVGDENRYLVDYADSAEEAQARINEWKAQHSIMGMGRILDAHKPGDFRELARNLTPGDFEELVSGAGVKNTPEVESLRAEVYEKYPSMGYQLKRKFYPGYPETNEFVIKSIAHQAEVYSSSYYNNIGREEGLKALDNTGIEITDRELWNVMRQYIEDETSTPRYNLADKIAFKARKFTYMMQLGYDVKQLYLNAVVQPITQNYNYLARIENPYTGKRLGGIAEVEKTFVKGTKLSLQLAKKAVEEKFGRPPIARNAEFVEFQDIYNQLKNERVIEPEYTKSLLELEAEKVSEIDSKFQSRTRRFFSRHQQEHWAGGLMRAGELVTRTQMAASMFVAGKKFGLSGDELVDFIVRGIDATQTNPSRGENPYLVRQFGEPGKLFYQFGAFRHMWFENLILNLKSDWKHKTPASTARTLAPLAIMGGITGLPLSGFAFSLYSLASGRNPDKDLKKWIKRKIADNDYLEATALYGITEQAAFSQSAGVQTPVLDTLTDQLAQDSWWDKLFSSNVPALMTAKQIGQGLSGVIAGTYNWDEKEIIKGLAQAAPIPGSKVIRNIAKAQIASREGYRTPKGTVILSKNKTSTPRLILGQAILGMSPNEVSEYYQDKKFKTLRKSSLGKATRRGYKKLRKAL